MPAFDLSGLSDEMFRYMTDRNIGVIKETEPDYDLDTGLPIGDVTSSTTYFHGFTDRIDASLIDGTNTLTGDETLYLERSANFEYGDVLEIRGERWSAVNPVDYAPTAIRQFWQIQVRRQ